MLAIAFLLIVFCVGLGVATVSVNLSKNASGFGTAKSAATITDATGTETSPTVPAAVSGTLSTRTNNTTGTLTMSGGHGLITGQRVDLYWSGGACYGAVLGTVSVNSCPIASVAGGDNLPAATTVIKVGKATSAPFAFTGDNLSYMEFVSGLTAGSRSYFVVADGSGNLFADLVTAGVDYVWDGVGTNPLAGDTPTKVYMSHEVTSSTTSLVARAVYH